MQPSHPSTFSSAAQAALHRPCRRLIALLTGSSLLLALASFGLLAASASAASFSPEQLAALEFRNIGPSRGGRSAAVSGVVGQPLVYYMGSTGGGVWKTSNAGQSWESIADDTFQTGSVGAIAVAASDPNVVVVGMGESPFRGVASSHGDGVYISTDAGHSWRHAGLTEARQISEIVIHPDHPKLIWAAVQGSPWGATETRGVYHSSDGGKSWQQQLFVSASSGAVDLRMQPGNPRILYAAMWDHQREPWEIRSGGEGSGIWKSTDGGQQWQRLQDGLPELMGKIGIAPSGAKPGLVWAIVEAKEKGGLYRSDDYGESWQHVNGERKLHARSWYYMHVFADPGNADVVHVLNAPYMKSIDGGKSFRQISTPHGDHHDHWINPDNADNMINANDGGATITFDGGQSWSSIHNQPTAQFYRVNADNDFAYRVYGGQQDNSTVAIASRAPQGDIDAADFQAVGGCESAHVAFDKNDPRLIYAGCYLGQISEYDSQTHAERDIRVYPELLFGVPPRERKYRFNWNAPIVVSSHDPKVIYHAGNRVFRSTDRGNSWTAISPDLTRNDVATQGPGGGPITNEVSENYNTIFYLAESPLDAAVLWAGSDDGLLHVSRDGGDSWDEVTPRGANRADMPAMINAIDASAHAAGTAFVAVTRYKHNDHSALIYATDDYGNSWRQLADDAFADVRTGEDFVRVVRQDTVQPELLFAGTETGLFVSFNAGADWQRMQNNLPRVPVTDLLVHGQDLVLSTQGRAFWILDNITPLRQLAGLNSDAVTLLQPATAYLLQGQTGGSGVGANPPAGASIDYWLPGSDDDDDDDDHGSTAELTLEILDDSDRVLRTLRAKQQHSQDSDRVLTSKPGLNRIQWDLRQAPVATIDQGFAVAAGSGKTLNGMHVAPGNYTLRLQHGGQTHTQLLSVAMDPRLDIAAADLAAFQQTKSEIADALGSLHDSLRQMRSLATQAKQRNELLHAEQDAELIAAGEAVIEASQSWQGSVHTSEWEFFQDVLNWPAKLDFNLQSLLYFSLDNTLPPLTQGLRQRSQDLLQAWQHAAAARDAVLAGEVAAYNTLFTASGQPGLVLVAADKEE